MSQTRLELPELERGPDSWSKTIKTAKIGSPRSNSEQVHGKEGLNFAQS